MTGRSLFELFQFESDDDFRRYVYALINTANKCSLSESAKDDVYSRVIEGVLKLMIRNGSTFDGGRHTRSYLGAIVKSAVRDECRSQARTPGNLPDALMEKTRESSLIDGRLLEAAIHLCCSNEERVLLEAIRDEVPYRTIAEMLSTENQVTEAAARKRGHRLLKELPSRLEGVSDAKLTEFIAIYEETMLRRAVTELRCRYDLVRDCLSERDRRLLQMLLAKRTTAEIAQQLGSRTNEVRHEIFSLLKKLRHFGTD